MDTSQSREVFCADQWFELTTTPGQGYNAVGYLNNGCSGFLIDANHFVAAGHCFKNNDGTWQPSLRFYPNFHPSRLGAPPHDHVPRGAVTRAVVATRRYLSEGGNDWGIGYVSSWDDTAGVDMTPVQLQDLGYVGLSLVQPGYPRHWFSPDGSISQMVPDWVNCNPPIWTSPLGQPPFGEVTACNRRWQPGRARYNCAVTSTSDASILHNCDVSGGNSGSALLTNASGQLVAVGVTGGSITQDEVTQWTDSFPPGPQCNANPFDMARQNYAAGSARFMNAPRFASNVAIANRKDGAAATGVFAADGDALRVRYRERIGASPTTSSPFAFWSDLGSISTLGALTSIAACNQHPRDQRPRVFVLYKLLQYGALYTNTAPFTGAWTSFGLPPGSSSAFDIDANYDANGRCQLFVVGSNGVAYTRRMTSDTTWSSTWDTVSTGTGSYRRITAAYNGSGIIWAAMINSSGALYSAKYNGSSWSTSGAFQLPISPPDTITDVDFGFNATNGNAVLWLLASDDTIWQREVSNSGSWPWWSNWPTVLYSDVLPPGATPDLATITASRWLESPTWKPMLFSTDTAGNVYQLTIAGGETGWKSFYSKYIPTAGGY